MPTDPIRDWYASLVAAGLDRLPAADVLASSRGGRLADEQPLPPGTERISSDGGGVFVRGGTGMTHSHERVARGHRHLRARLKRDGADAWQPSARPRPEGQEPTQLGRAANEQAVEAFLLGVVPGRTGWLISARPTGRGAGIHAPTLARALVVLALIRRGASVSAAVAEWLRWDRELGGPLSARRSYRRAARVRRQLDTPGGLQGERFLDQKAWDDFVSSVHDDQKRIWRSLSL